MTSNNRTADKRPAYVNFEAGTRNFELDVAMISSTEASPKSLFPGDQPLEQYKSLAPLSFVAVGLGLASALVLTTPLLAPLPVAGIVAGVAALRSIASSRGQLAGRSLAIAGLCLATFFLGLGLSRHLARQVILAQHAHKMADVFLTLLQEGKSKEAHQFRQSPALRITAPEAIAEYYDKNEEAAKELQGFVANSPIKDLILLGRDANLRFEGISSATQEGYNDLLVLKYSYNPDPTKPDERQSTWVHINRKYDESTKRHEWEIGGLQTTPPLGAEP